jgi:hypothetical protein
MGFGVWLAGATDQPYPKSSFFRRLRRESGRGFHKASDFVKAAESLEGIRSANIQLCYTIRGKEH